MRDDIPVVHANFIIGCHQQMNAYRIHVTTDRKFMEMVHAPTVQSLPELFPMQIIYVQQISVLKESVFFLMEHVRHVQHTQDNSKELFADLKLAQLERGSYKMALVNSVQITHKSHRISFHVKHHTVQDLVISLWQLMELVSTAPHILQ